MTKIRSLFIWVIILSAVLLSGCKTDLYSGLDEKDVNQMLALLLENGVSAEKRFDNRASSYTLRVKDNSLPRAVNLLREYGFPREKVASISDMFRKEGLISSPTEERVRYIFALSQSVQETISQIDGVLVARVHVVVPEPTPGRTSTAPSSASVFIKYHPAYDLESMQADIKLIVERSIEGLTYDKVSVVMVPAQINSTIR